jgi:hypothetical protein
MNDLSVPLARSQVDAAGRLHAELPFWGAADNALEALARKFPGYQNEAALLKVVAINSLYYTNVFAVSRMARHVESVMTEFEPDTSSPELVARIADLPMTANQKRARRFLSFASKFAHFFVNSESFPMFDSFAGTLIKLHLGRKGYRTDQDRPYAAYVDNFQKLSRLSGWTGSARGLDRYLWIAGQFRAFRSKKKVPINRELHQLFVEPPPKIHRDLDLLLGASPAEGA